VAKRRLKTAKDEARLDKQWKSEADTRETAMAAFSIDNKTYNKEGIISGVEYIFQFLQLLSSC
jgi:hypothetical protein